MYDESFRYPSDGSAGCWVNIDRRTARYRVGESGRAVLLPVLDIRAADLASRAPLRDDLNDRPKLGVGMGGLNVRNWVLLTPGRLETKIRGRVASA